jgi:hypothetical protein
MSNRELISNTLENLIAQATFSTPLGVNSVTTWATLSRRIVVPPPPAINQPAAYLVAHDEDDVIQGRGVPVRRVVPYSLVCFCRAEIGDVGDTFLNVMMDAVETALLPTKGDLPFNVQTLGGLVYKCEIVGKIFRDPGDIDNQAMLIIPIVCMLP